MVFIVLGALLIGLSLGVMGSGGSILTVPVLTYLLGHDNKAAIAESLAIVGGIALVGALPYAMSRQVDWRSVLYFGLPGMAGTYLGAWMAKYVSGGVQLVLFAVVMLLAAWLMARPPKFVREAEDNRGEVDHRPMAFWKIGLEGLGVGLLTGLVGVGGGFLIVPALVLLGGLPMRLAIGTSLAVIALKSASGLWKYLDVLESLGESVNWATVAAFIAVGIAGSFIGKAISSRIDQRTLRRSFAVFLVIMGAFVLSKETPGVIAQWRGDAALTHEETSDSHRKRTDLEERDRWIETALQKHQEGTAQHKGVKL